MGPFYFAWVDPTETFGVGHLREDEQVLHWKIEHNEGDFASLELEVRNPRVGFLAPGRKVWAFLSFIPEGETSATLLFFGRLVGVPEDLENETVTMSFVARPPDYNEQKLMVAETKKVRPYWDPIWFAPETRDDPDNVLESRPELWHIDRTTLEVSTSNILVGEDGVLIVGEGDIIYETMRMTYGQTPLTRIDVTASVSWAQFGTGAIDISDKLNFGAPHSILTYTGKGLIDSWPKTGANLGGGWTVAEGSVTRVDGIGNAIWGYGLRNVGNPGFGANPFGRSYIASEDFHDVIVPAWATASEFNVAGGGSGITASFPAHTLGIPRWRMIPVMRLSFSTTRQRSEGLTFSLSADMQAILTDPGDNAIEALAFSSSEITTDLDPSDDSGGLQMPIRSLTARSYFTTDRGDQSIEYLIALARSHLLARSRCVMIEFEIPFLTGVGFDLSCRKDMFLTDARLPGGSAGGKIISYTLSSDGDSGAQTCDITIGCTVGKGSSFAASEGTPTYVDDGYVELGYQRYDGALIAPFASEVVYASINGLPPNDDGIDLDNLNEDNAVLSVTKTNTYQDQEAAMGTSADEPNDVFDRVNTVPTTFSVELLPLNGGPFATNYAVAVSALSIPKTIDLEAEVVS